jgi:hypothetical protein
MSECLSEAQAEGLMLLAPVVVQRVMLGHVDALLAGAQRRSVLLCDSSKEGEDGG